ncbi:DUF3347 domain-containing protein [Chryseobacterium taklimakanense]|uniref:DUF3347 domain-containing protein n=1 Tax=Chryseobacterium taklimakanense TaxID=536441 RepID=UPI000F5EDCA3|nr:DUF3347 domain-containing protein [Chryseobacterium taklimakanense]AZI22685.1 DUF3347 domain-containing protein [Chryseobacterium taklimakanense]
MKTIITLALAAITFTACSKNETKTQETATAEQMDHSAMADHEESGMDHSAMTSEEMADHEMSADKATPEVSAVSRKSQISLQSVVSSYLSLKNALVDDDAKSASTAAASLKSAISALDKNAVPSDKAASFNDLVADAAEHAYHINAKAGDIEHQREHFALLSKDVYQLAKDFGAGQTLYKEYCPMFNDNKGGFWLSESKEIKNPLFGQKMVKCGEVQETLN